MDAVLQSATRQLLNMFPAADFARVGMAIGSHDGKTFQPQYTVYIEFHPSVGHVLVINPIFEMAMAKAMAQAVEKCRIATQPPPPSHHPRLCLN